MVAAFGKTLGLAVVVALGVGHAAPVFAAADPFARQKDEIRKIEEEMAPAQDIGPVVKHYHDDVVLDDVVPGQWRGKKAVSEHLAALFAVIKDVKASVISLTVEADDHLGFAHSVQSWAWTGADGKRNEMIVRQADMFKRVDGVFKLIYQQVSIPVDAKTGTGVFKQPLVNGLPEQRSGGF